MLDKSTLSKDGQDSFTLPTTLKDDLYPSYKVLIIGDPGIGKTSLIHRYVSNEYSEDQRFTIGLDYRLKKVQVTQNDEIILSLWDTAGSEKFHSLAQNYFTNSDGIILCFDNSNKTTFNNLYDWINYINNYVEIIDKNDIIKETKDKEDEDDGEEEDKKVVIRWFDDNEQTRPIIVLAGTKSDLEEKEVKIEDINELKKYLDCEYFETSSKNGNGVGDLFFFLAKNLFEKIDKSQNKKETGFKLENKRINEENENACNSKLSCC